jgi:hypothetical protein
MMGRLCNLTALCHVYAFVKSSTVPNLAKRMCALMSAYHLTLALLRLLVQSMLHVLV